MNEFYLSSMVTEELILLLEREGREAAIRHCFCVLGSLNAFVRRFGNQDELKEVLTHLQVTGK